MNASRFALPALALLLCAHGAPSGRTRQTRRTYPSSLRARGSRADDQRGDAPADAAADPQGQVRPRAAAGDAGQQRRHVDPRRTRPQPRSDRPGPRRRVRRLRVHRSRRRPDRTGNPRHDRRDAPGGRGLRSLRRRGPLFHSFTLEYMVHMRVPEWGPGKHMYIAFHDGAIVTPRGIEFPYPPDPEIRLIR